VKVSIVSLFVMLAGLGGGKYALFQYRLKRGLADVRVGCYLFQMPPPRWNILDALPSVIEAVVLIALAGVIGVFVPWRRRATREATAGQTDKARQRLRRQLVDEGKFPDDVKEQLED
jgi:hypothetical protein